MSLISSRSSSKSRKNKVQLVERKVGTRREVGASLLSVLAVTYDLEVEQAGGTDHLRSQPLVQVRQSRKYLFSFVVTLLIMQRTTQFYHPKNTNTAQKDGKIAGFFLGGEVEVEAEEEKFDTFNYWREPVPEIELGLDFLGGDGEDDGNSVEDFGYDSDKENDSSEEEESQDDEDDDDDGWITPGNFTEKKKQFNGEVVGEEDAKVILILLNSRE